ncbi:MAG: sun protein [Myxococcales bacterium]|nr:sun protein [Myxococcales bacterium]
MSGPVSAREVARRVLDRIEKDRAWATPALDGELARAGLDDRDRRLASELVYGVLRHRTRIDRAIKAHADLKKTPPRVLTALRIATYQLLFLDRVPGYAAVDDAVAAARAAGGQKLAGFTNAVLRKISTTKEPPLPALPAGADRETRLARLELEYSLPRWILDELASAVDDGVPVLTSVGEVVADPAAPADALAAVASAFAHSAPLVARANRRKVTREELAAELTASGIVVTPIASAPGALRIDGLGDPGKNPAFVAGRWTVQDTGAQLVAHAATPARGMRILDACAGVGGKSTHLAELCDDAGAIDAADLNKVKLGLLAETAERLGLTSIRRLVCDLLDPAAPLAPQYDLIVLDAPCSGLGVLRRHPDAKWRLVPGDVPRLAKLQTQLLDAVLPRLAPGGVLVYSVCTFTRAEGPDQIARLTAHSDLKLVAEHRTWPPDADAFYLARLERPM